MASAHRGGIREALGHALGRAWAAPIAAISRARRARTFHPRGLLLDATLAPIPHATFPHVAQRLAGPALVRLSGAVSKTPREHFEVLGLALRVSSLPVTSATPRAGDQDLTFATILSPVTMPIAPFTTRSGDFFANRFYAVAPFEVASAFVAKLRLVPAHPAQIRPYTTRARRLEAALREGDARFVLELRRTWTRTWHPIATLTLTRFSAVDDDALRFDPFRDGRGITPIGFVHAIRRAVYPASQAARPPGRTTRPLFRPSA